MAKSSKAINKGKKPKKSAKSASQAPAKKQAAKKQTVKQKSLPKAKASARPSASIARKPKRVAAAKPTPKKSALKKAAPKKSALKKPSNLSVKKLSARKPVRLKSAVKSRAKIAPKATRMTDHVRIAPKGKKISQKSKIIAGKSKRGPKIAKMIVGKPVSATAIRVAAIAKNGTGRKVILLKNKNFKMSTESINNQNEVSPGGGVVLPATKSAPAMNLRPDDAAILASATDRYGRKDLDMFKNLLNEQMKEAKEEFEILSQNILDTSGEFEADNQNYSLHTAEQGTDAIEREKTFLHAQRTSDYIKKLEEAIERIDRGIYGICVVCGRLIEKERLQAVPITQKHVDCKNRTQPRKLSGGSGFRDHEEQPPANNVE